MYIVCAPLSLVDFVNWLDFSGGGVLCCSPFLFLEVLSCALCILCGAFWIASLNT